MALFGGNLEKKEIGLALGVSGTYKNTEIDKTTGHLRLTQMDFDSNENPIYAAEGSWTSDVINLGDKFNRYEKIFTTNTTNGSSSFTVSTRVSANGVNWSDWLPIAADGTIQSSMKPYIQVRIDLLAGFVSDEFIIAKGDFEANEFVEEKEYKKSGYIVPKLTSNTSSTEGFAFASSQYNTSYPAWKAFDKVDTSEGYVTAGGTIAGFIGFCFNTEKIITKYKLRSMASNSHITSMPKNWIVQGSNNTTNGLDGDWVILDTQTNQSWKAVNTDNEYSFSTIAKFKAYRVKWSENNGYSTYTGIGELDFFENSLSTLKLKRDYIFEQQQDLDWSDVGSLHRIKISRGQWQRIDRLEVK